jgi:hypothetical protein
MARRWLAFLLASIALAQDGGQGPEPTAPARRRPREIKKVDRSTASGSLTIRVPVDWTLEEIDGTPAEQTAFGLRVADNECSLNVFDHGFEVSPRAGPVWIELLRKAPAPQFWGEPLPHVFVPQLGVKDWGRITVFVRASGRTFELDLQGPAACLEQAGADLMAAAATLRTTAPEWPPITKDYRIVRVGEYRLAVHRSVSGPTQRFESSIRDAQKICDRLHGRMPKPAVGEPVPVVYLHSERAQQEAILPRLKEVTTPNSLCLSGLCIFAMTTDPNEPDTAGSLVYTIGEFNTLWRWGSMIPNWVRVGERIVVGNLHQTGKDLPYVTAERIGWREGLELRPLPELTWEAANTDWKNFYRQAFFYAALFHAGPESCRVAYRAFLDDVRKSCDPDGAVRRHLEPLGYDRLREDAERFMREDILLAEGS